MKKMNVFFFFFGGGRGGGGGGGGGGDRSDKKLYTNGDSKPMNFKGFGGSFLKLNSK